MKKDGIKVIRVYVLLFSFLWGISPENALCSRLESEPLLSDTDDLTGYTAYGQGLFTWAHSVKSPYSVNFNKSGKELCYLAVKHAYGVEHPTNKKLKLVLQSFEPDCLILEGFDNSAESVQRELDAINQCHLSSISESQYAIHLTYRKGIPFIGGEPEESIVQKHLIPKYQEADLWYRDFIAYIHQEFRNGDVYLTVEDYLKDYSPETPIDYFDNWCERRLGGVPNIKSLRDSEYTAPIKEGHFVQRLTAEISDIRNYEILSRIEECMGQYQKVMVIYGSSHYYQQHKILEKEYGPPVYESQNFCERCCFGDVLKFMKRTVISNMPCLQG